LMICIIILALPLTLLLRQQNAKLDKQTI